jgi:transcriptional regulator with GAF, ATPase, and Fis domain
LHRKDDAERDADDLPYDFMHLCESRLRREPAGCRVGHGFPCSLNLAIVDQVSVDTNDVSRFDEAPPNGLRIAELVAEVSRQFIDLPAQEIDRGIDGALRAIVDALGFDRGILTAVPPQKNALIVTHRYHARPPRRHIEVGDSLPLLALPWSTSQVLAGVDVRVADAAEVAEHAPVDAARLAEAGIRALAGLPVLVDGQVTAALILIAEQSSELVYLDSLRTVVRIFASALDKKRLDLALASRLRLTEMVGDISRRFIDVPLAEIRKSIDEALQRIAALYEFKRAVLYELSDDRKRYSITHRYLAPGIEPTEPTGVEQPIERFGYVASRLALKQPIVIASEGSPEEAATERRDLSAGGMTHALVFPLVVGADPLGAVTFSGVSPPDPMFVEMLGVVGELFTSALHRERVERGLVERIEEISRLKRQIEGERDYLREEVREGRQSGDLVGESPALERLLALVESVASTPATVLIRGESGVGKELIARAIHSRSLRSEEPLVKVNCASVPKELFESEFFGHVRGAFTGALKDRTGRFELADRGTLFLDEVGEIPLDLQAKLLRVLQEKEFERVGAEKTRKVDVRIIAATNRDLAAEAAAGRFRKDLYYRLNVFPIEIPPLRERREDILPLAEHFLKLQRRILARPHLVFSEEHRRRLLAYDWPGNVRELQHVIERAVILSREGPLRLDLALPAVGAVEATERKERVLTEEALREMERGNLTTALDRCDWRISGAGGAAEMLGLSPSTLRDRMRVFEIQRPKRH